MNEVPQVCGACGRAYADHCPTYLATIKKVQHQLERSRERNKKLREALDRRDERLEDLTGTLKVIKNALGRSNANI